MAAGQTRLQRRGGRYWFRAKVPAELREIIGKSEYHYSLRTSDAAEARQLLSIESTKVNAELATARRKLAQQPVTRLSKAEADFLTFEWFHEADRQRLASSLPSPMDIPDRRDELASEMRDLQDEDNENALQAVQGELTAILERHHISIDLQHPTLRPLYSGVHRAMQEQVRRKLRQLTDAKLPTDELFKGISGDQELQIKPPTSFGRLVELYLSDRSGQSLSPKSELKRAVHLRVLREIIGPDTAVHSIDRTMARRVRETLATLPVNASKRVSGNAIEASRIGKEKSMEPISPVTANAYLRTLHSLLELAVTERLLPTNPTNGLKFPDNGPSAKARRHALSTDQLQTIFSAPLYTGCTDDFRGYAKPGPNIIRKGRFWVPLISLFSGMRLNEICMLEVADVERVDETDVIVVRGDDKGIKRVKTDAGWRYVPIHPELVRFGFLDHVDKARRNADQRLFPDLQIGSTGYGSDPFSKWFSRFMASLDIKTRRTSFHSFRHTYRDALREADISRERVRALGGWSDGGSEEIYGNGLKASTLATEISKIGYPELDLEHLARAG
ncbi:site-specific integrase [Kaistia sp. MMO-174]|uniref:site-specific integrase n=1 Tax=Kaistia sp. MMO-174 TaxID=3081256 RepID=UPI0030179799